MRVAVIGAGISGLVVADRLHHQHQVTLFESNDYFGGHTNTVEVVIGDETHAVDTGFIVFNDWTYPKFIELLDDLGVSSQPTTMGFSVRDDRKGLEYSGESLGGLFAQPANFFSPSFHRLVFDILKFNRLALQQIDSLDDRSTVRSFLDRNCFSEQFAEQYLLPMGSAIWSCPMGRFNDFPIRFILEFYRNHGLLSIWQRPVWRVISGGSQVYVRALLNRFRGIRRPNTPVLGLQRDAEGVELVIRDHPPQRFDHVIFACHSDQALQIIGPQATVAEREILSAFPYQRNEVVLHTDDSVLPRQRRAWASWNYRIIQAAEEQATLTYNMNILQGIKSRHTFCVSLNQQSAIDPTKILRQFVYQHPVFTEGRGAAQARHQELLNANHTSFCGAYWGNGFHEDGVVSALRVAESLKNGSNAADLVSSGGAHAR
ncbi:NAD(P)/FAD-dependent oxidoreductase [Schlesneria sp. DSM 10557]|uniref:NAD(P)/FAD-dependent oxidoreductase n=1 Tax=Schlesneria sp. DSM 10557 TaxID=3044399 RepID=UPI0035A134D3